LSRKTDSIVVFSKQTGIGKQNTLTSFSAALTSHLSQACGPIKVSLICQSNLSNHIKTSLSKIKYRKRGLDSVFITPNVSPDSDDKCEDVDGWKFNDGPLHGDTLPDDDHGLDTAVVEDVDGLFMPPASFIPRGVT
jgi:hypothetical protein